MNGIFYEADSFNQDISNWGICNVEKMYFENQYRMFKSCPILLVYKQVFN